MHPFSPQVFIAVFFILFSSSSFLDEEIILLLSSTAFFATLFARLRVLLSDSLGEQLDQVYTSYAVVLESRILLLSSLLGLSRRLAGFLLALSRFALVLLLSFEGSPSPSLLPSPLAAIRREAVSAISHAEEARAARFFATFQRGIGFFRQLIGEDHVVRLYGSRAHIHREIYSNTFSIPCIALHPDNTFRCAVKIDSHVLKHLRLWSTVLSL